jgi:hypothetical protein
MLTLSEALALDDLAEVNWGELAADLLSPAQQDVYESIRIPAWEAYQERVAHYADYHWQIAELVMPSVYKNYMRATAQAFKTAANYREMVAA